MNIQEEIQKAIGAHRQWKQRLHAAIDSGTFDQSVSTVCQDNQCAFGKWLYSLDRKTSSSNRYQCVKAAHADFHREAARILKLALDGKKKDAEEGLSFSSKFAAVSAKLTLEMIAWKNEVDPVSVGHEGLAIKI
jgi:hypothetical protein